MASVPSHLPPVGTKQATLIEHSKGTRWRSGTLLAAAARARLSSRSVSSLPDCSYCAPAWTIAEVGFRVFRFIVAAVAEVFGRARGPEEQFRQALDCTGRQGALSWEDVLPPASPGCEATALLQPVDSRFTEGVTRPI
jgi:hypothetical protein